MTIFPKIVVILQMCSHTNLLLLNFSDELRPLTRFYEQNQISIGAAHHSADSTIADLGLSQACRRIWDGACAFFMPFS